MTLNIKFKSTLLGQIWYLFGLGYCFTVASTAIAKPQLEAALPPLEAVQQSLVEHPNVRAAISEQDYADFARQGLKVGQNPWTVTAGMQVRKTDTQLERKQANSYEPSLGIEKQIRLPNKYRLDQDLAQRISSIAELKYENAQHQASKMLLNSWFAYMRSTLHLKRLQEQLDQIQQFIQVTEQRIRAGDAPRLELMLLKKPQPWQ
ncbi:TolC family protein (plasmid) [Acinetobacter baumannii]|uniref:TolC family protein n=1 Tax=Acinetobacter baumannii TaxID=470 RepID=UPI001CE1D27B|nr:TolC family protein [Acinetobacter baumannii]UBX42545.1 TolC family protein [Acinetobacter baumannii]